MNWLLRFLRWKRKWLIILFINLEIKFEESYIIFIKLNCMLSKFIEEYKGLFFF